MRNARFGLILTLVVALLATGCGIVEVDTGEGGDYPNQEISFIIPFDAGSAPDSTFRKLSEIAEKELGQPIVILNRPGGGGTVGTAEIVGANPDGYTIGASTIAALTISPQLIENASYEGPSDLQPIMQATTVPSVLFVNADSGIQTIDDFVQRAKEEPSSVSIGIPTAHSTFDIQVELLMREADIELEKIEFGAGQQVLPVVNGTIDAAVAQPSVVLQYVEQGDLRIVGAFGEQKPEAVEAPLATEAGYDVTLLGYEGVVAPKDTPAERVQIIHDAYKAALESEEFQEFAKETGTLVTYEGTEAFEQRLEADTEAVRQYIEEFGWKQS